MNVGRAASVISDISMGSSKRIKPGNALASASEAGEKEERMSLDGHQTREGSAMASVSTPSLRSLTGRTGSCEIDGVLNRLLHLPRERRP